MNLWKTNNNSFTRGSLLILAAAIILAVAMLVSFSIGRYPLKIIDILNYFFRGKSSDASLSIVLIKVRLPRILGAVITGGALSIAGASYQSMFRNPMVSPDILGVTSGAGFGASLAILLSLNMFGIQGFAFVFGIMAVLLAYGVSRALSQSHDKTLMLVLSGMVVSTLFASLISLLKYVADTDSKLPSITFWLMGSLANIGMSDLKVVIPIVLSGLIPLLLVSWRMNVLSFGDEEAKAMGIHTDKLRVLVIICASLVTATVIAITGHIGWIGLIIPHFARLITGPDNKVLMPFSFFMGSTFLLLVDDVARSISALEIPLGIITSLLGAPFFLIFLRKSQKRTW
jgi:iron complex transport system permease protein